MTLDSIRNSCDVLKPDVSVHNEHNPEFETSAVVLIQLFEGQIAQKSGP